MNYKLLVVESPAKAHKIARFLGSGWKVEASLGHIRDLPDYDLGVNVKQDFALTYEMMPGKQPVVKRLVKAMREASEIYLATDPDREGEAIAWHIREVAHLAKDKPVYRITFTAITQAAVLAAIATPRALDMNLIEAQQTRRAIDRLTGYLASALTSRALNKRASAGRVQSVALRLVVEREQAIAAFVPKKYWTLAVRLQASTGEFIASLKMVKNQAVEQLTIEQAELLLKKLAGASFWVKSVTHSEQVQQSGAPFTTATLQQAASKALGLPPDETMQLAQKLYEAGRITYMRTDGVDVAPEAQQAAQALITEKHGTAYVPANPPTYKARHNAQEAHEAIRPTDLTTSRPDKKDDLTEQLYTLIWQRFIASQMAPARFEKTQIAVLVGPIVGQPYPMDFEVHDQKLVFDGFLAVYCEALDDGELPADDATDPLPTVTNNETLAWRDWLKTEHATRTPERFTEASLVQALEQRGIGRPATYASTVKLVRDKGYVVRSGKRLVPTDDGKQLCAFVTSHFPDVFEYEYTAQLEIALDKIVAGEATRLAVLIAFWQKFDPSLKAVGELVNKLLSERPQPKLSGQICPKCGKPLVKRDSHYGKFTGCSNYPTCRFTAALEFSGQQAK